MSDARLVAIGNCTLDFAFRMPRFPRPGETLLVDPPSRDVGGKGANQAVAAARAGVPVLFCSALGRDEEGAVIRDRLRTEGLDLEHVVETSGPTDRSIILVAGDGENSIVSTHAAAAAMDEAIVAPVLGAVGAGDVLLMQGNLGRDVTRACLAEGRRRGLVTVLNPAPIHYPFDDLWPLVDCAILNRVETAEATGSTDPARGAAWLLARQVRHAVVTLGAAGALAAGPGGTVRIAAPAVAAVDTTGAGDVFCGVLAACLARGLGVEASVAPAVRAATLAVARPGTQSAFPTRSEIETVLAEADIPEHP